ncbi:GD10447 [Drosophila simulans]|uniref:GD10447 n=1 Tax=Drosophila simulans TaxID=7240 RepID=B4QDU5_DROSI|nr:GD10447 [Drosophila simulans]
MYCTTRLLRYVLCVISGICALGGCLLIWYGAWLLDSLSEEQRVLGMDHGEDLGAVLCILLGTVIVVASIFGSVAVAKDSRTLLICYAVLLVFLLIVQIVLVSISYAASRDFLPDSLRQGLDDLWDLQHEGNSTLNTYEEWAPLTAVAATMPRTTCTWISCLLPSCCLNRDCTKHLNLFMTGCEVKFKEYVTNKTANFHSLSWFLVIFEFAGSVTTCYLVDSIRNQRDRIRFYN